MLLPSLTICINKDKRYDQKLQQRFCQGVNLKNSHFFSPGHLVTHFFFPVTLTKYHKYRLNNAQSLSVGIKISRREHEVHVVSSPEHIVGLLQKVCLGEMDKHFLVAVSWSQESCSSVQDPKFELQGLEPVEEVVQVFQVHVSWHVFGVPRPLYHYLYVGRPFDGLLHSFEALHVQAFDVEEGEVDDCGAVEDVVDQIDLYLMFLIARASEFFEGLFRLDDGSAGVEEVDHDIGLHFGVSGCVGVDRGSVLEFVDVYIFDEDVSGDFVGLEEVYLSFAACFFGKYDGLYSDVGSDIEQSISFFDQSAVGEYVLGGPGAVSLDYFSDGSVPSVDDHVDIGVDGIDQELDGTDLVADVLAVGSSDRADDVVGVGRKGQGEKDSQNGPHIYLYFQPMLISGISDNYYPCYLS